ncbi:MAG: hypothetical protein KF819_12020 [Labilithrix sp.]|nr:hypothetical protein [Labilithrix sp.]
MRRRGEMRRLVVFAAIVAGLASLTGLGGCAADPSSESQEDDYTASDFAEDAVLPYKGAWLDAPKALAGVGQFDRLRTTIYDDAKCSTMVAVAAAIVAGEERFVNLLDAVEQKRGGRRDDLATIARVREGVAARRLTPRHLHELTEVIVRAYKVAHGAYDEQIAEMIRASGYAAVEIGSTRPDVLVDRLAENEVVPLSIVAEGIPHITLLWKDARGTVRLYDSDDVKGSHVMPRGSAPYRARIDDPQSSWDLAEKYR